MRPKDPNLFSTPTRNIGPSAASAETYAHSLSAPKLNSFELALAKKGISLQAAAEKSSSGSATNEVYFADTNGHRVRWVFTFVFLRSQFDVLSALFLWCAK